MTTKRSRKLQLRINKHLEHRKFAWLRIKPDGELGRRSFHAASFVAWMLGFRGKLVEHIRKGHLGFFAYHLIMHPNLRTPAMRRRDRERRKKAALYRHRHKNQGTLGSVKVITTPGEPHWGGGNDVMEQFVAPFMLHKFGLYEGSGKRTPSENAAVGGSPTSDHLTTNTTTMARDFPTYNGEAAARALAHAMGYDGWQENSYTSFNIAVDGRTFRVQILWGAAIDHSDHVHVGIGLA